MSRHVRQIIGGPSLIRLVSPRLSKSGRNITSGNMIVDPDFREFIQSLNNNQVKYLIIGGYAVAFHGHPRYTKDLDVWIELSEENASRLVAALDAFGFGSLGLQPSDFLEPNQVIQLGYPPSRIDILMTPKGIEFGTCYENRVVIESDGVNFAFIDLDNLLKNKRATGRHQDMADVENLEK